MKFLSQIFSEARGSVAGQTFSRNGNGAYVRARAVPVNPNTAAQSNARTSFGSFASLWRSLAQSERNGFITLAQNITFTDKLGQQIHLSGFQLFQKLNQTLFSAGQSPIESAPTQVSIPDVNLTTFSIGVDAGTGIADLGVELSDSPATGFTLVIEATTGVSAGRSFFGRSSYKAIHTIENPTTTAVDLTAPYEARFGDLGEKVGQKIAVRARLVHNASGFASSWVNAQAVVTLE